MKDILAKRGLPTDEDHAGIPDTSSLLYLQTQGQWVRQDKISFSADAKTGVQGHPQFASAELGKIYLDLKVELATVKQIQIACWRVAGRARRNRLRQLRLRTIPSTKRAGRRRCHFHAPAPFIVCASATYTCNGPTSSSIGTNMIDVRRGADLVLLAIVCGAVLILSAAEGRADSVSDFYKGKTITFVVGMLHPGRRVRPLCPSAVPTSQQSHSRETADRAAEHARRVEPGGGELHLQRRAEGRHRARDRRPVAAAGPGDGRSGDPVRYDEAELDSVIPSPRTTRRSPGTRPA